MRLSVAKRSNPFKEGEVPEDQQRAEEGKVVNTNHTSPIKSNLTNSDEKLNQAKLICASNNERSSDALTQLMNNRHKQKDVLDQLDKIYTCTN